MTSRRIRDYEITRRLGRGGMGVVYLAVDRRDGRTVALKQVETSDDEDQELVINAERRGAELQREFGSSSVYVPAVYETFDEDGDFFIAMEFVDGRDLSDIIKAGPVEPGRAARIAIQLCRFLEQAHSFPALIDGRTGFLLHGDLTPRNIRLSGDDVKVLDFGIAKAVSLTRRVTTNTHGNHAYLPPERLDEGTMNAEGDLWAVGVGIYEMILGRRPFRGDTHAVEARILSRRPPEPLTNCPLGLTAIVARMLEGDPSNRYPTARAIREDLERFLADGVPDALREGWPDRAYVPADEPATRPTKVRRREEQDEQDEQDEDGVPTRRTFAEAEPAATRRRVIAPPAFVSPVADIDVAPPERVRGMAMRGRLASLLLLVVIAVAGNEAWVWFQAKRLTTGIAAQDLVSVNRQWRQYDALGARSLGLGTSGLAKALVTRTAALAEDTYAGYRQSAPEIREGRWKELKTALQHAIAIDRGDNEFVAGVRYADGHLHRIQGEADRRSNAASAERHFADAVAAFQEAARKRPKWADPHLGLVRTYVYDLEDIGAAVASLEEARATGFVPKEREIAQIADGYKRAGDRFRAEADTLRDYEGEREKLTRAAECYREAMRGYAEIRWFRRAPENLQLCFDALKRVERRLEELGGQVPAPLSQERN